jgi:membrane protease YdiL (CAAX protease family)
MPEQRRLLAVVVLVAGIAGMAMSAVVGGAGDGLGPTRLSLAVGLSSLGLAAIALAGALWSGEGVSAALGLRENGLRRAEIVLLALGTVGASHVLDVTMLAVAPGIGEELLFRGFVLRRTAAHYGLWVGIVVSSLLFGLMHLDVAQSPAAALLGLYLGAVAVASRGTAAAVVCHVTNNLAVLLATGLAVGGGAESLVVALVAAVVGCAVLARALRA